MGLRAQLEPRGLHASSGLRPDLLLSLPGRLIMTNIAVCHPLAPEWAGRSNGTCMLGRARCMEAIKRRKYAQLASQRQHELLPFVAETCGGLAPSAVNGSEADAGDGAGSCTAPCPVVEDRHSSGTSGIGRHRRAARKRHGVPRGIRQQPACDEQRECGSDGRWR